MSDMPELKRYSVIHEKNKREIIMLRGRGCAWRRCRFCDYHLDYSENEELNFALNEEQLNKVTGIYEQLEIINSGSFVDLDEHTMQRIKSTIESKGISTLYFECHWLHRDKIKAFKEFFSESNIKIKSGVETFDILFRESYLDKGMGTVKPSEIAEYFDECCLLFGLPGQNIASMLLDINTGLQYFERVCINIMQTNSAPIKPDPAVIEMFRKYVYPIFINNWRVDILMENTAFGVGQ